MGMSHIYIYIYMYTSNNCLGISYPVRTCDLIVEPEDEPELRKALGKNESVNKIFALPATADSPVVIHYDHKLAGEAATNPKQRVPPFKEWHQAKCLRSWMAHRGGSDAADSLHEADEYVVLDGGKGGLFKELTKIFKEKTHDVRHVTVMYLRDDVQARREKTKQGSVNQIEGKLHITAAITDRPVRVSKHYAASSDGNAIGPIRLPAWGASHVLMLTPADKAKLFGNRRWDVGGLGRVEAVDEVQPRKKLKWADNTEDEEPAFFHSPCLEYYEDELQLSGAVAVIDFTCGPGYLLWACVMRGTPSVGVCMSAEHLDATYAHMVGLCLTAMCKEGNDLYDARFVEVLGAHGETASAAAAKASAAGAAGSGRGNGGGQPGRGRGKGRGRGGKPGKGRGRNGGQPDESTEQDEGAEPGEAEEEGETLDDAEAAGSQPAGSAAAAGGGGTSTQTAAEQRLLTKLRSMGCKPFVG